MHWNFQTFLNLNTFYNADDFTEIEVLQNMI